MSDATQEHPLIAFCRDLPGATEDIKWDHNLVFSVRAKIFAVFDLPDAEPFGFKVAPDLFEDLVQRSGIVPAPYLARHHWVRVQTFDALPLDTTKDFIEASYRLVVSKLPKKAQRELGWL